MMVLYSILCIVAFVYILSLCIAIMGWMKLPMVSQHDTSRKYSTKVSIIIPARNEEETIANCLQSIQAQDFPKDLVEIIIIDDASDDETVLKLEALKKEMPIIIIRNAIHEGKKKSLTKAIALAQGELIITRDADTVSYSNDWLTTLVGFYEAHKSDMLICPVTYTRPVNVLEQVQYIENLALTGFSAGFSAWKHPFLCSGANLAFTKSFYAQVNGYATHATISSGDDVLLLETFKKHGAKINWLKSIDASVITPPVKDIMSFIYQRVRWAGKFNANTNKLNTLLGGSIVITNLFIYLLLIGCIAEWISFYFFLLFITSKAIFDILLLFLVARFFKQRVSLWRVLGFEIIYGVYLFIITISVFFITPTWKGKQITK